jgi:hypothetical protein
MRRAGVGILVAFLPAAFSQEATVKRYCAGCHNQQVKSGGLALDALLGESPARHPAEWEKAVRKLNARQMPPEGAPRPDEATYNALLGYLESSLDAAAAARPDPGRTDTFRRLNRSEYRNAIRDLLAIDVDVAALLPADDASRGFDNVTLGELSPTLLERYLSAARKISRLAVGLPERAPGGHTVVLHPELTQEGRDPRLPPGTRGGAAVDHTFPLDATYEFQIRLTRDRNEDIEGLYEPHELEITVDGERVALFTVTPPPRGQDNQRQDQHLKTRAAVKAGPRTVGVTFLRKPLTIVETERQPYQSRFNAYRHPRTQPAVYSISINGPYDAQGPGDTPSRRRLFVCDPASGEEDCARRILSTLMKRAYRRPATEADLRTPLKLYREARAKSTFDAGIEMALNAVLVSPDFLFRVEQDPDGLPSGTAYRLSDLEIASRLSFFLWSSIPDDELLEAAIAGKLRAPGEIERQVRRMLADRRSRALAINFAGQWLYLRNLESTSPDMRLYPDFDENLRQAMREETELFFESVMREDRGVLDLLRADYTYLNERLAKHYGIPHIYGSRFRRVALEPSSRRGGLLRQASVLTVTSYATRTSPVIRGNWVLANLVGAPPPPPPASVPALKERGSGPKALSMRERLSEHRDNPACSGCHKLMDPVGFALENYDAVGRWRVHEDGKPIDAEGGLPDGSRFEGVEGLERALLARPELFVSTLTEKLMTYALGRGVEHYDAPAVRRIVREARPSNYRFSSIILGITASTPFQMRRSP